MEKINGGIGPAVSGVQLKEMALIKQTFKDNESLLKTIRALFLGIELLDDEKAHIKSVFSNPELVTMMWRRFLPDIKGSRDLPLGQIQDIWLGAEAMIFGAPPVQIEQATKYKELSIEYTKQALNLLIDPDAAKVAYTVSSYMEDPLQINLMARNMFLKHMDQQLLMIYLVANAKEDTKEQQAEKNIRNGSK